MLVYDFKDYKAFLRRMLPSSGEGRGGRARLAERLGCKAGFVSQVLSGEANFSCEHAVQIADILELGAGERDYFLLLVNHARAGSVRLRSYYAEKIAALLAERQAIRTRIEASAELDVEQAHEYYSAWFLTALHMCALVPQYAEADRAARYLSISPLEARRGFDTLERIGLVKREGNRYLSTGRRFHVADRSPALRAHHLNWRLGAMRSLDGPRDPNLHFSSVMSISATAASAIRAALVKTIEQLEPTIREARDESVFALTMDLFEVGGDRTG